MSSRLGFLSLIFVYALSAAPLSAEESLILEEPTPIEDLVFVEQPIFDNETYVEEVISDDETLIFEEPVSFEESYLFDDFDDLLFYEAPDLVIEVPAFEPRFFDEIFPNLTRSQRRDVMGPLGLRHSFERGGSPLIAPDPDSGIDLLTSVMQKNPSHIVEALVVVPYNEKKFDILDIYNALGRIENIKDQTVTLRDGSEFNIFTETTRLQSAQNRRAISDPLPAETVPFSETVFLRFSDTFIGSIYLRGEMSISLYGITYDMTNFRGINFSIFRIMRAERVSIIIYVEPIEEGILIYGMSGFFLPGFIVSRMNLTPNINTRISILKNWVVEGLKLQERLAVEQEEEVLTRSILLMGS